MKDKAGWVGTIMLLVGIVVGIVIGPPLLNYHLAPSPTAEHREIVDRLNIIDTVYNSVLVPECVEAGKSAQLSVVTAGEEYQHSVWIFYTFESQGYEGKDANAAMELWGSLDDGNYCGMISKLAGNTLTVLYMNTDVAILDGDVTTIGFTVLANGTFLG